MSLIGSQTITIPDAVQLKIEGDLVTVTGPKGELTQTVHRLIKLEQQENKLFVRRSNDTKPAKSLHGTTQRLISNMIIGVTQGFSKNLELIGTGYRVAKQGTKLNFSLGYSHPIEYTAPSGISFEVEGNNKITVNGIDKQNVGHTAAIIRSFRPPEPYKGKGIRYADEIVRRKQGKTAKSSS